jgi:hypothetical protein
MAIRMATDLGTIGQTSLHPELTKAEWMNFGATWFSDIQWNLKEVHEWQITNDLETERWRETYRYAAFFVQGKLVAEISLSGKDIVFYDEALDQDRTMSQWAVWMIRYARKFDETGTSGWTTVTVDPLIYTTTGISDSPES